MKYAKEFGYAGNMLPILINYMVIHHTLTYWRIILSMIKLDKFLDTIPDQPKMLNYVTASGSNDILDQLTHLRAQGIYHSGGVPDSAMEQS